MGHEALDHAFVEGPDRDRAAEQEQEAPGPEGPPEALPPGMAADRQWLEAGRDGTRRGGFVQARRQRRLARLPQPRPRAGTTIRGPLVMSQTNATPTSDAARKSNAADRQPGPSISWAVTGRASASPRPGPA